MFEKLTDKIIRSVGRFFYGEQLTEDNLKKSIEEIRKSLLDSDIALEVVDIFINRIKEEAIGKEITKGLKPTEVFLKIMYDELIKILGSSTVDTNLTIPGSVLMLVGLQGSGKTTTAIKIASLLKQRKNANVVLASVDIYRPAAIDQLEIMSKENELDFYKPDANISNNPIEISNMAKKYATSKNAILILDTAGRLHIDEEMMNELISIEKNVNPYETFLVLDSMIGRDSINVAKEYVKKINITGMVLTKLDSDSKGGVALSVRQLLNVPIRFSCFGEKSGDIDIFHPDRMASRILDMGDILTLVEDMQRKLDKEKSEKLFHKMKKGLRLDLDDFRDQLNQMMKMGGIASLMDKLPGLASLPQLKNKMIDDSKFKKMIAILNSMTKKERKFPNIIDISRKRRIAKGSGTEITDVNQLIKQFEQMQKMTSDIKSGKFQEMIKAMSERQR